MDPFHVRSESSATGPSRNESSDTNEHTIISPDPPSPHFEEIKTYHGTERFNRGSVASLTRRNTSVALADEHVLLELARTVTSKHEGNAYDPTHPDFDLPKWLRLTVRRFDEQGVKAGRAGIFFKNLGISGSGSALQLQQTLASTLSPIQLAESFSFAKSEHKQILQNFNGSLRSGELLLVLGRPGSGCSTFLKTMCGEMHGLNMDENSTISYNGIPQDLMMKEFKGEVVYNQEVDKHFPHLTVGQTLEFAAEARSPHSDPLPGMSRSEFSSHVTRVVMAVFGLSHTYNTKVGNDFVRGVSGGERKRVSIAEMALSATPLAAWDNSTRGLDSATALKFVASLRTLADLSGSAHAVAIYQASQAIYDIFDKVILLHEGRQIYYGPASKAKQYFEAQGWLCPARQTTGDFLTSITNPTERQVRPGLENKVPRTAEDFERAWMASHAYQDNQRDIAMHERDSKDDGLVERLRSTKTLIQSKHAHHESPYVLTPHAQVVLCMRRSYQRIWNDKSSTLSNIAGQVVIALIISSIYYGTPNSTQGFTAKGATIFFAVLINALNAISEINTLYAQRPIVEKHASYAFYHPFAEALAGYISDIPIKFVLAIVFNVILYFITGLRREAGPFFIFFLFAFLTTLTMSAIFRTLGAATKTISQAMALAGVMTLALVNYAGYQLPVPTMKPWFGWIRFINPVFYSFEAMIANEFHNQQFPCASITPAYTPRIGDSFICGVIGAVPGELTVNGDRYISINYEYTYAHVWRNLGILLGFLIGFLIAYVVVSEVNSSSASTAEFLVFRNREAAASMTHGQDEEIVNTEGFTKEQMPSESMNSLAPQTDTFTWKNVCYDIKIKEEPRRLLDEVSGFVKPGTLTALMGVSGAGKTTLLDVLASRTSMGIITGDMLVNGRPLDASFQRKTGYVQQQDLHLETSTVRESLRFSAMLRQPASVSKEDKYQHVEEVIKMLNMQDFAEAVVGTPGEGLNVEQRKLLTIGVELAAKPKLLLFLDEPTSGLDSQSSWAICSFLRKLADNGQAVLCTIHQPSAILFQQFDRLLFLAKGGRTVYFGPIGTNSRTLLDYFHTHGARHCADEENPAEYMLEIANAKDRDWPQVWKTSAEFHALHSEIDRLHDEGRLKPVDHDHGSLDEFAMPLSTQIYVVTYRTFQQYWRTPSYIIAKWALGMAAGLFIGFSYYQSDSSVQGTQNIIFSGFQVSTIFSTLVQQIMPLFVSQRSLYEVRERPSKSYSWKAFLIANMAAEIPYNVMTGIIVFATYSYPIVGILSPERQGLILLLCVQFFIYAGTFAHMCIAALPDAQTASTVVTLLFAMSLVFNGVMQAPSALPRFWIFMYRVSPFTYWIAGLMAVQGAGREIVCSAAETNVFSPPLNQTCAAYLAEYLTMAPGRLQNPDATQDCRYCSLSSTDQFLGALGIRYDERWRNFGIMWVYIIFNIFAATGTYYAFRVVKWDGEKVRRDLKGFGKALFGRHTPNAKDKRGRKEMEVARPF
ncbi:ABC-2 type transporter-like protein 6 [Elsinoe fawcettii]|nr:ABC-2 type transporter-like protein 6 [Elsinoe fawcettii]